MLDLNAVWIATYAASFVAQHERERIDLYDSPKAKSLRVEAIANRAAAVADSAVGAVSEHVLPRRETR
jgi:hypothetical protein